MHSINNEKIHKLLFNIHDLPVTQIHNLFGKVDCNNIKDLILDYEKINPMGMESNVKAWSSNYYTHDETDVFLDYVNRISEVSQNTYNNMFSANSELLLSNFWVSHYRKGDYTKKHNHAPTYQRTVLSGCYYAHVEKGSSPIIFEGEEPIYPENDTLIIFSSNLYHEVPPTDTERIVMSFNLVQNSAPEFNPSNLKDIENLLINDQNLSSTENVL